MVASSGGCQAIAGVETRTLDPRTGGCTLPTGAAKVRLANLVVGDSKIDACIRASGTDYRRPVLRDAGTDCQAGFVYGEVSAPLGVSAGKIDVKIIPAGQTCGAPALGEALGVTLAAGEQVTVALVGNTGSTKAVPLAESPGVSPGNLKLRFVNAIAGSKPLSLGVTKDGRLPTDLTATILSAPVPFGGVVPAGAKAIAGTLDANGYLSLFATEYQLGAAEDGSTKAQLVVSLPNSPAIYSLYAIGSATDAAHPIRGLLCNESLIKGIGTQCTVTALPTLSIDVFNVGLTGAGSPSEDARRPYVVDEIGKRASDMMCLVDVSRKSDRDAIAAASASKSGLVSVYAPTIDSGTPPTDPTNQAGAVPPPPAAPPCGGSIDPKQVDDILSCFVANCSKVAGDMTSVLNGDVSCLSSKCASQILPLYGGTPPEQNCFECIATAVGAYDSWQKTKKVCTTDARVHYPFDGQNPSMILSRFPIISSDVFVLPSTNFRRTVLYAQLQIEPTQTIDYYCAQLSSPLFDDALPYTGNYGGVDLSRGYDNEALLQVQKAIAWIARKSSGRPTIISGDWQASVAVTQGSVKVLADSNPEVIKSLRSSFAEAVAPDWVPTCTYCPSPKNPYNGTFVGLAPEGVYLFNWPEHATTEEAILYDSPVVPLPTGKGMLSPWFGLGVRVVRP